MLPGAVSGGKNNGVIQNNWKYIHDLNGSVFYT